MIGRWLAAYGSSKRVRTEVDEYYECTCCMVEFDERITDCPVCGQLVVRIVVPPR